MISSLLKPIIFAPLLALYIILWALPATWWFEPQSLIVAEVEPGQDLQVALTRTVHRTFQGSYTADVRSVDTGLHACGLGGAHRYRAGLDGTYAISLRTLAGGDTECSTLPAGVFFAEVCWTVDTPAWGIVPPKTTCIRSNPFRVTGES